jgi:tryptophan-rich sensory protein
MTKWTLADARRRLPPDADGRFDPWTAGIISAAAVGAVSILAIALPSVQNSPKRFIWYRKLDKPKATPPDIVFGIAWPVIETALAVSGWRLLRKPASPRRNAALAVLAFNLSLIPGYNALFFTARSVTGGLLSATALAAGAWAYVALAWKVDRGAALAGAPLAGWTSFAEYLMVEVWRRNAKAARSLTSS